MRKLMWFALGLVLMCWAVAYLDIYAALALGILALLGVPICFVFQHKGWGIRAVTLVCLGLVTGFLVGAWNTRVNLDKAAAYDGKTEQICATVTDYSVETDYGCAVQAKCKLSGKEIAVQLYLNDEISLSPGDRIEGLFLFRYTGGKDATYHFGKGILLLGYQRDTANMTPVQTTPIQLYPAVLRRQIENAIDRHFPADTAFFARALLLGDRTDVDYEMNTAFKVTGISHIIAVSGMHVSILASVVYVLAARKRWLMALLGIPTVLLFAAVAGFTPSITRACIMQILLLVALIFDRDYDPMTSLAATSVVMLMANPMVVTSVSFQLSFGCMAGIFLFSSGIYEKIKQLKLWRDSKPKTLRGMLRGWIAGSVSVTLGAMAFTTPLCAAHFGSVSLIGILTNLLVLWLVGWIFPGIILVCALSAVHSGIAVSAAWIISWPIRLLLGFIQWLAELPLAAVYTKSVVIVCWLVLLYGMIGIFLLLKKKQARMLLFGGSITLCVALLASWAVPATNNVTLTVLDVGQGQSVILTAEGRTFLIDCGGDYDEDAADMAAETLLSQGIFRIDGVIVTHYDRDHAGGIAYFLSRIPVDKVFLPDTAQISSAKADIVSAAGNGAITVREDIRMQWEDCTLEIYAPVLSNSDNESGISVLFSGDNCDILITGDMNALGEALLLSGKKLPKLEALVVGHHGSRHSTGEKLLEATHPEHAFISVGKDNSYGHPAQEVLDRLAKYGCEVHRTDEEGTIVFRR